MDRQGNYDNERLFGGISRGIKVGANLCHSSSHWR